MKKNKTIKEIETCNDIISGRGGLVLFLRYIQQIHFFQLIESKLGFIKLGPKGLSLFQFTKQIIAFFVDGTYTALSHFDKLKNDDGYAAILENSEEEMASSHQIKRFFSKLMFNKLTNTIYRKVLHELFIWRLRIEKPSIIILGGDTMVLNNDDAKKREGVEPTYKKKKGFQPLHISWDVFLIDILFRTGSKHSNHANDFRETIEDIVHLIRARYNEEVPIILVADSGFFDQKNFTYFEKELKIHYIITGKMYEDLKAYISQIDFRMYRQFDHNGLWSYFEFGDRRNSWDTFRRVIFTTLETDENGQFCLDFVKTDMVLYTNIGIDPVLDEKLIQAGRKDLFTADSIIRLAHQRGRDELIHRSIKEFAGKEQLPFKKLEMNRGFYYFLAFAHFLFECFKRDVSHDVIAIGSYPTTFRRKIIDFAAKVVSHSGQIILKVMTSVCNSLKIQTLWERCQNPPNPIFFS